MRTDEIEDRLDAISVQLEAISKKIGLISVISFVFILAYLDNIGFFFW